MNGLPVSLRPLAPELRKHFPANWIVLSVGPGTALDLQGNMHQIPQLQSYHAPDFLDELEGTIARIRGALAFEGEAARLDIASARQRRRRRTQGAGQLPVADDGMGTLTHLSVARVADADADAVEEEEQKKEALEVALSPTVSNDPATIRRVMEGLRGLDK